MNSYRKTCLLTFAGTLALAICVPAIAQQSADLAHNQPILSRLTRRGVLARRRRQRRRRHHPVQAPTPT